ncbi:putative outer membrane adhesin [Balamuthia mandrillaris]
MKSAVTVQRLALWEPIMALLTLACLAPIVVLANTFPSGCPIPPPVAQPFIVTEQLKLRGTDSIAWIWNLATGGDVNGDGKTASRLVDIVTGVGIERSNSGSAYVLFGTTEKRVVAGGALNGINGFRMDGQPNDQIDDIGVGAPGAPAESGYVVYGRREPYPSGSWPLTDLNGTNGFRFQASGQTGIGGAGADLNGDGKGDLVVGAWTAGFNGPSTGSIWVVFGGENVAPSGSMRSWDAAGTTGYRIDGPVHFGATIKRIGDFNGDGIDDIVTGAEYYDGAFSDTGAIYVIFGTINDRPDVLDVDIMVQNGEAIRVEGPAQDSHIGLHLSPIGDFNGDGLADVATRVDDSVYVLLGTNQTVSPTTFRHLDGVNGFRVRHQLGSHQLFGDDIAAGDINKDGLDDLIITAGYSSFITPNGGGAYIIFGTSTPAGDIFVANLNGQNGFRLDGSEFGTILGEGLVAGDFDGDGQDDFFICKQSDRYCYLQPGCSVLCPYCQAPQTLKNLVTSCSCQCPTGFAKEGTTCRELVPPPPPDPPAPLCGSNAWLCADGSCASDILSCQCVYAQNGCPTAKPCRCHSGMCASNIQACSCSTSNGVTGISCLGGTCSQDPTKCAPPTVSVVVQPTDVLVDQASPVNPIDVKVVVREQSQNNSVATLSITKLVVPSVIQVRDVLPQDEPVSIKKKQPLVPSVEVSIIPLDSNNPAITAISTQLDLEWELPTTQFPGITPDSKLVLGEVLHEGNTNIRQPVTFSLNTNSISIKAKDVAIKSGDSPSRFTVLLTEDDDDGGQHNLLIITITTVCGVVFLAVAFVAGFFLYQRRKRNTAKAQLEEKLSHFSIASPRAL